MKSGFSVGEVANGSIAWAFSQGKPRNHISPSQAEECESVMWIYSSSLKLRPQPPSKSPQLPSSSTPSFSLWLSSRAALPHLAIAPLPSGSLFHPLFSCSFSHSPLLSIASYSSSFFLIPLLQFPSRMTSGFPRGGRNPSSHSSFQCLQVLSRSDSICSGLIHSCHEHSSSSRLIGNEIGASPSLPSLGSAPGWPLIRSSRSCTGARATHSASITQIPMVPCGDGAEPHNSWPEYVLLMCLPKCHRHPVGDGHCSPVKCFLWFSPSHSHYSWEVKRGQWLCLF